MPSTYASPLRQTTRALLALSFGGLLVGASSCSAELEGGNLIPPGTVVDECPPGHACQTNNDGTIVVVGNDSNPVPPGTVVDECPPGYTCQTNDDGTVVVVDNGTGGPNGTGGFVGSGGSFGSGGNVGAGGNVGVGGTVGSGGGTSTCTDVQHPDHQDKPCSVWVEWGECGSDWMKGYCDATCGRCTPDTGSGGSSGSGGSGGNLGNETLPDINGGDIKWASRYWDCCKPHCAWSHQGNAPTTPTCGPDGLSQISSNEESSCKQPQHEAGNGYMCYNQAPRAVSNNISYGYVAIPNPTCGACYHIQFTGEGQHSPNDPGAQALAGKHMIVKVTNTGGDVAGNQFDLLIPGGGVGAFPEGCAKQLPSVDMGPVQGGFLSACSGDHNARKQCVRDKCNQLPAGDLRDGCYWFVDWYQVADNPKFRYEPIACPADF